MNPREKGFLLLSSHLGSGQRRPLSAAQLRTLAQAMGNMAAPAAERELNLDDLVKLGISRELGNRILDLLREEAVLEYYCTKGRKAGCVPLTRVSEGYPPQLRQRLGLDAPGCLWAKGDISLLRKPAIALVGSRELRPENRAFARAAGLLAAENNWVLVSGNARGADREAQEAALQAGGNVISIVADRLEEKQEKENLLYLSEDGYGEVFSSQRALSRNRCIHALGQVTFVAQATLEKGGTWNGTVQNLRHGWSTVIAFRDGSEASLSLERQGAYLFTLEELKEFSVPVAEEFRLF